MGQKRDRSDRRDKEQLARRGHEDGVVGTVRTEAVRTMWRGLIRSMLVGRVSRQADKLLEEVSWHSQTSRESSVWLLRYLLKE